jgi:hypothetical protein
LEQKACAWNDLKTELAEAKELPPIFELVAEISKRPVTAG